MPRARADLARILLFNSRRSSTWAEKVQRRLSERMGVLLSTSQLGGRVPGQSVKRLSITDIQYVIDYERTEDGVRILRIRHAREVR